MAALTLERALPVERSLARLSKRGRMAADRRMRPRHINVRTLYRFSRVAPERVVGRSTWQLIPAAWLVAAFVLSGCQGLPDLSGASSAEIAKALVDARRVPGISFAVLMDGEVVSSGALGVADLETGEPVRPDTLFEGASLTKPVVATLAMRLFEVGAFDLDESVAQVVMAPRIRDRATYASVTPRHLLAHTSGLPNWSGDPLDLERGNVLEFKFPPGQGFSYSGEGYGILGEFLEKKSGRSLENLSRELFDELGMSCTTLAGASSQGSVARGHWGRSPSREARRTEHPIAALSLLTHAEDYARLLRYAAVGNTFSPETLAEFRKRQVTIESSDAPRSSYNLGWSLGWGVLERSDGVIYFQWGDNGPFRAFAAFSQSTANGIVYFANGSDGLLYADELAQPVLGDLSPATAWFSRPGLEWVRRIIRY